MSIKAEDEVTIKGWFIYGNSPFKKQDGSFKEKKRYTDEQRPTLVFMHENAGNLGLRLPFYKMMAHQLEVNILTMAYRGYSYSDQVKVDEAGLKKDGAAIVAFLRDPSPEIAKHMNPQLLFL